jgi:hypothetical protein
VGQAVHPNQRSTAPFPLADTETGQYHRFRRPGTGEYTQDAGATMADGESRGKEKFGYVIAVVTIAVSIWSLYYSGTQARLARKGFELQFCTSTGKLEKQITELHELLTSQQKGHDLASVLERLAQLQNQIAEHQAKLAEQPADRDLAGIHQGLADLQKELAQLQRDRDAKAREIEALRGTVARLEQAQKTASGAWTAGLPSLSQPGASGTVGLGTGTSSPISGSSSLSVRMLENLNHPAIDPMPGLGAAALLSKPWPPLLTVEPRPETSTSFWGRMVALLGDLGEVFKKHPGTSVYFGIALVIGLGKLFGSK